MPDAVAGGVCGYLVEPLDLDALQNVKHLVTDETLRKQMGEYGYARVQWEFTIDAIGRQLLAMVQPWLTT